MKRRDVVDSCCLRPLGASFLFTASRARLRSARARRSPRRDRRGHAGAAARAADLSELPARHAVPAARAVNTAIPFSLSPTPRCRSPRARIDPQRHRAAVHRARRLLWLRERLTRCSGSHGDRMAGVACFREQGAIHPRRQASDRRGVLASSRTGVGERRQRYFTGCAAGGGAGARAQQPPSIAVCAASWPAGALRAVDWGPRSRSRAVHRAAYILYFRLIARVGPPRR